MADQFVTCSLEEIIVGEPLPVTLYVYINFRFITYRADGGVIDRATFDRLIQNKVKNLFLQERDRQKFSAWARATAAGLVSPEPTSVEMKKLKASRDDVHRKMMDIFTSEHPDRMVSQVLDVSKKLVDDVMAIPFAVKSLKELQTYSRGTVDHSVNVSVLSTYLALQMGYSHAVILQHIGMGALMHDIGKTQVPIADSDSKDVIEQKMKAHPELGLKMIDGQDALPNEVKMIIAQHHECFDGTGFPKKLRGNAIYDLARIVAIANNFDELVGDGRGTLVERQKAAIKQLDEVLYRRFDSQKLEKALKILKLGV